jgi:hypothetical protein
MATSIGGWFDKVFFDSHGKPCAGGTLFFYQTGTDVPSPVATADGTLLGASVKLDDDGRPDTDFRFYADKIYRVVVVDAEGERVTQIDDVAIPESEGGAMYNPMTAQADIIVGGAGGEPTRLEGASSPSFLRSMNSVVGKVLQWVGLTGSNGVKVTNGTSGTEIGLDTTGASEGDALKFVNGAPAWTTDEKGMENPMTTKGDIIVGGASGTPARLGVGADGDILAAALSGGSVVPQWEAGPKKYRNVYNNIPSPQINDGYLGCLFYLSGGADQTLYLPSVADIPSKSFIDFVCLDNAASLAITPQGTTTLNAQGSAVTIGGKSASFYRLTFLGHGVGGDEWAVGGTDTAAQPGDHKTAVDGSDTSPDYLAAKLAAGSGISLTNTGSAVSIAADAQEGDHHVVVTGADASAGTLADKLVAGSNVTITTQTDGDGVQTLEISATGGGGGGGGADNYHLQYPDHKIYVNANYITFVKVPGILLPQKIGSWTFWPRESPTTLAGFRCWCALFEERDNSQNINISSFTYPVTPPTPNRNGDPITFNFDSLVTIDKTKLYRVGIWFGGTGISSVFVNAPQTAQDSGNWTWFWCGYASATPPADTSGLSTSSITEVPWFSLNERTI